MKTRLILCLLATTTAVSADDALDIAKRSLPFIKEKGLAWIEDRQCASCHQIPSMLWSLNSAARAELDTERKETNEWTPWATDWRHWNQTGEKDGVDKVSAGNIDTMAFLILGSSEKKLPWVGGFRAQILKNQQSDGSWKAGGQLPLGKRPARETMEVTTMWTLLALKLVEGDPARKRAENYLAKAQPGLSTEWHAVRLLLNPDDEALRDGLLKLQHEDGGWGWLINASSDAFGTGLALYALVKSGLPLSHKARKNAVAFLQRTQAADGSWAVPSTRARDNDKINKTATYWGTAWAVIGLLEGKELLNKEVPPC